MEQKKKKQEQRISIRFPLDVLEAIRKQAAENNRSLNGQVVFMLRTLLTQERKEGK